MSKKASKIENVAIKIVRMTESSGNIQFFVRATRTDDDELFGNNLEYQCFQTAYNGHIQPEEECVDHAIFAAGFLLKFFGHSAKDLQFIGLTDENMETVKEAKRFWRVNE